MLGLGPARFPLPTLTHTHPEIPSHCTHSPQHCTGPPWADQRHDDGSVYVWRGCMDPDPVRHGDGSAGQGVHRWAHPADQLHADGNQSHLVCGEEGGPGSPVSPTWGQSAQVSCRVGKYRKERAMPKILTVHICMLILLHGMHTCSYTIHLRHSLSSTQYPVSEWRNSSLLSKKTSDWSNELNLLNLVNLILFGIFQICLGVLTIINVSDSCLISCSVRFFASAHPTCIT